VARATVNQQASVLGSIRVIVERFCVRRLHVPRKRGTMYHPQALTASKELVKKKHISHMMQYVIIFATTLTGRDANNHHRTGEIKPSGLSDFEPNEYLPYSDRNCHEYEFIFRYRSESNS
jgi:hypothetical protein